MVDGGHTLNAWLTPLSRPEPPRVSPEEETVQLKHDLDLLGTGGAEGDGSGGNRGASAGHRGSVPDRFFR